MYRHHQPWAPAQHKEQLSSEYLLVRSIFNCVVERGLTVFCAPLIFQLRCHLYKFNAYVGNSKVTRVSLRW